MESRKKREKTAQEFADMYKFDIKYIPIVGSVFNKSPDPKFMKTLQEKENDISKKDDKSWIKKTFEGMDLNEISKTLASFKSDMPAKEKAHEKRSKEMSGEEINASAIRIISQKMQIYHLEQYYKERFAAEYNIQDKDKGPLKYLSVARIEEIRNSVQPKENDDTDVIQRRINYDLKHIEKDKNPSKLAEDYVEECIKRAYYLENPQNNRQRKSSLQYEQHQYQSASQESESEFQTIDSINRKIVEINSRLETNRTERKEAMNGQGFSGKTLQKLISRIELDESELQRLQNLKQSMLLSSVSNTPQMFFNSNSNVVLNNNNNNNNMPVLDKETQQKVDKLQNEREQLVYERNNLKGELYQEQNPPNWTNQKERITQDRTTKLNKSINDKDERIKQIDTEIVKLQSPKPITTKPGF